LERLTTLLPNAKVSVETLTIPPETKKDEFGSMPDLRGPVPEIESDEDEDDITLAELKEQLEDNMTLAEIQQQLDKVEATKKRLETIRLKKEKKEEEEVHFESEAEYLRWDALRPFGFVDEMTYHSQTCGELRNF
tara:strand:+ start:103 stop:507 length:405 start_codon:yes stop_codon:yes gene_type:complete